MNKHKASLLFLSIAVLYFIVASWHTTILQNFPDSTLSMYLYYSGKKRAWFDDVSVKHFKGYSYRLE